MKKLLVLPVAMLILASCGGKQSDLKIDTLNADSIAVVDNAKNSLSYVGIYNGPCPLGDDFTISVTLNEDSTFVRTAVNNKDEKSKEEKGTYSWDETGFIINLNAEGEPKQYFVAENQLLYLDEKGEKISVATDGKFAPLVKLTALDAIK